MTITKKMTVLLGGLFALMAVVPALAETDVATGAEDKIRVIGMPQPGQIGFQPAATDIMQQTVVFHDDLLMPLMAVPIAVFVGLLMLYVLWRFRAKKNPVPRQFSHNTFIEIAWTLVPAIIVFVIAIYSVRQVYFQSAPPEDLAAYTGITPYEGEVVLKATGNRWYWEYSYPDEGVEVISNIVEDEDLKEGEPRLLTVDNRIVLPVNTVIRLQVTANPADVIHSWTIPAFGVKMDAVPGRLNERWFRVLPGFEGRYYGQCSELCGERHAYMPIMVDVVSPAKYQDWLTEQKIEMGLIEPAETLPEGPVDTGPAEEIPADMPADVSAVGDDKNDKTAVLAAIQDEAAE